MIRLYEQATSADPGYALAREGAAEAWAVRPNFSSEWASDLARAEEQAQAALSLDGTLTRARLVLASIHRDRWEWEEAERGYELSLASLPNDPEAHHEYGEFLLDVGRCLEAASEQRIALETDPLSSVFHYFLSMALLCDGQIDAAVAEGRRHQ